MQSSLMWVVRRGGHSGHKCRTLHPRGCSLAPASTTGTFRHYQVITGLIVDLIIRFTVVEPRPFSNPCNLWDFRASIHKLDLMYLVLPDTDAASEVGLSNR